MKLDDSFDVFRADIVAPSGLYQTKAPARSAQRHLGMRILDLAIVILAAPSVLAVAVILLLLNPVSNPGPLFFRQKRMGKDGVPFMMWKFRTMRPAFSELRSPDEPLDRHRITPLGALLRRSRLDELPNLLNVARGEMAIVGPRPDAWDHAIVHMHSIPHYPKRFAVLPGITGLAQVRSGYADDLPGIRRKARFDAFYVRKRSFAMDMGIVLATFTVMFTGFGAR